MITILHFSPFLSHPICSLSELVIDFPENVAFVSISHVPVSLSSSLDRQNYYRKILPALIIDILRSDTKLIIKQTDQKQMRRAR
jgi:hypothetical protein